MKLSLSLAVLAATAVHGFAPAATTFGLRQSTNLFGRVDSSEAVKAAMEASKKFGPTSPEARMAWETVEEMDSSDTRCVFFNYPIETRYHIPCATNESHSRQ